MQINIKHFEQFFTDKQLKKGLQLFLKGEVESLAIQASADLYFIVSKNEISLKIKSDKLTACTCTCKVKPICSHVAAALFFLQKETFDPQLSVKSEAQTKIKRSKKISNETQALLKKKKQELLKLEEFLHKQKRQVYAWELLPLLGENSSLQLNDIYSLLLDHLLEPFLPMTSLGDKDIKDLSKKITVFSESSIAKSAKDKFFVRLAIAESFIKIFNFRFTGDECVLKEIYSNTCKELDKIFDKGLSDLQEKALHTTLLRSVESNKNLSSGVFEFLIPHWLVSAKDKHQLWQLTQILEKRQLKVHYSERFNKLLIARQMVFLREEKLFKTPLPIIPGLNVVESVLALAELDLVSGKQERAFKALDEQLDLIKTNTPEYYLVYLEHIIRKASLYKRTDLEVKYLKESFINGLFIQTDKLRYFLKLLPAKERETELQSLLKSIKKNPFNYSFEKVSVVLWEAELWDELILEIKKHKNKFQLLHEVLVKKLPEYSAEYLKIYSNQLIASMLEKDFFPYQIELLEKSKEYLKRLPDSEKEPFLHSLMNGLLKQSQIYRRIKQELETEYN